MEYKRELEKINTPEKAYLIGLFYADGCLVSNNVKRKNTNAVRISLTDQQLIEDLYKLFPFFNKNSYDFSKHNPNCLIQYSLSKKNKLLYQDCFNAGIFPRKSAENSEQLLIPQIEKHLISHFIRGYFDGDGSISISSKRPNLRRVEICTTSLSLITDIIKEFKRNSINVPIFRTKNHDKNKTLYVIEWVKSEDVLKLKEYLYKNSTICLERKFKLFESFKIIKKISNNPLCEKCGKHSRKDGHRYQGEKIHQRYYCADCKFSFQKLKN